MRKIAIPTVLCLLMLAKTAQGQSRLPAAYAGLTAAEGSVVSAAQLETAFPEQAGILRELGVEKAELRTYRKDSSTRIVTLLEFRDPTGAYGGYQLLTSPNLQPATGAELGGASDTLALFAISNLVVRVEGQGLKRESTELQILLADLKALARKEAGPYPNLSQYFPPGAVPGSRRFALGHMGLENAISTGKGDWLGFEMGAEVESARYKAGGGEATLLLASYPTPQVAIAREKSLSRWFNVNRSEEVVAGRPVIFVRRMTSMLAILSGSDSQKESEALLGRINYQTELTWNEPSHLATDPPWGKTLYNIFLGTFYFGGFAIAIGFAFAAFRLGVKKILPGKVFDRSENVEILQLGLASKPIEGKDFYQ